MEYVDDTVGFEPIDCPKDLGAPSAEVFCLGGYGHGVVHRHD